MTSGRMLRPALVCLLAFLAGGCSLVEGDPHRFENLAQDIAAIPVDGGNAGLRSAAEAGLRPAVRVEVLDPHDFWDARDGFVQKTVERAAPAMAEAAIPAAAQAVVDRVEGAFVRNEAREAPRPPSIGQEERRTIQLGAYSTQLAAQAAWTEFNEGDARLVLSDLQPRYETAKVNGRAVVRLKVSAPADRVRSVCQTTRTVAPWCAPKV